MATYRVTVDINDSPAQAAAARINRALKSYEQGVGNFVGGVDRAVNSTSASISRLSSVLNNAAIQSTNAFAGFANRIPVTITIAGSRASEILQQQFLRAFANIDSLFLRTATRGADSFARALATIQSGLVGAGRGAATLAAQFIEMRSVLRGLPSEAAALFREAAGTVRIPRPDFRPILASFVELTSRGRTAFQAIQREVDFLSRSGSFLGRTLRVAFSGLFDAIGDEAARGARFIFEPIRTTFANTINEMSRGFSSFFRNTRQLFGGIGTQIQDQSISKASAGLASLERNYTSTASRIRDVSEEISRRLGLITQGIQGAFQSAFVRIRGELLGGALLALAQLEIRTDQTTRRISTLVSQISGLRNTRLAILFDPARTIAGIQSVYRIFESGAAAASRRIREELLGAFIISGSGVERSFNALVQSAQSASSQISLAFARSSAFISNAFSSVSRSAGDQLRAGVLSSILATESGIVLAMARIQRSLSQPLRIGTQGTNVEIDVPRILAFAQSAYRAIASGAAATGQRIRSEVLGTLLVAFSEVENRAQLAARTINQLIARAADSRIGRIAVQIDGQRIIETATRAFNAISSGAASVSQRIRGELGAAFIAGFSGAERQIQRFAQSVPIAMVSATTGAVQIARTAAGEIRGLFSGIFQGISATNFGRDIARQTGVLRNLAQDVRTSLSDIPREFSRLFTDAFAGLNVAQIIRRNLADLPRELRSLVSGVFRGIDLTGGANLAGTLIRDIRQTLSTIRPEFRRAFTDAGREAVTALRSLRTALVPVRVQVATAAAMSELRTFSAQARTAFRALQPFFRSLWSGVQSTASSAFASMRSGAASTARAIGASFGGIGLMLRNALSPLGQAGGGFLRLTGIAAIGSTIGNLLANAISGAFNNALAQVQSFFNDIVEQTRKAEFAQQFLNSAVREYGGFIGQATEESRQLARELGSSRAESTNLLATAYRIAGLAQTDVDPATIVRRFADAAAASGEAVNRLPDLMRMVLSGQDEVFDRLFGVNPITIYKQYSDQVGKAVNELSDFEKIQARLNAVLDKGAENTGKAAERMATFSGLLIRIPNLINDIQASIGEVIGRNQGVLNLLNGISTALSGLADRKDLIESAVSGILNAFLTIGEVGAKIGITFAIIFEQLRPAFELISEEANIAFSGIVDQSDEAAAQSAAAWEFSTISIASTIGQLPNNIRIWYLQIEVATKKLGLVFDPIFEGIATGFRNTVIQVLDLVKSMYGTFQQAAEQIANSEFGGILFGRTAQVAAAGFAAGAGSITSGIDREIARLNKFGAERAIQFPLQLTNQENIVKELENTIKQLQNQQEKGLEKSKANTAGLLDIYRRIVEQLKAARDAVNKFNEPPKANGPAEALNAYLKELDRLEQKLERNLSIQRELFQSYGQGLGEISKIDAELRGLEGRLVFKGRATGFYGQQTDDPVYERVFDKTESAADTIKRAFDVANQTMQAFGTSFFDFNRNLQQTSELMETTILSIGINGASGIREVQQVPGLRSIDPAEDWSVIGNEMGETMSRAFANAATGTIIQSVTRATTPQEYIDTGEKLITEMQGFVTKNAEQFAAITGAALLTPEQQQLSREEQERRKNEQEQRLIAAKQIVATLQNVGLQDIASSPFASQYKQALRIIREDQEQKNKETLEKNRKNIDDIRDIIDQIKKLPESEVFKGMSLSDIIERMTNPKVQIGVTVNSTREFETKITDGSENMGGKLRPRQPNDPFTGGPQGTFGGP